MDFLLLGFLNNLLIDFKKIEFVFETICTMICKILHFVQVPFRNIKIENININSKRELYGKYLFDKEIGSCWYYCGFF